ncbi:hypothetical protein OHD16_19965 [Sphingobacterium sp. ML3W]|uniref:hypothetical protein n=1 Tax=unclassified Sphingobacterium TaxID=2609468 RepID=UPI000CE9B51D|nr:MULTISPECIES: hypothetical protein [unclassified Sphingobacterium]WFA82236.1 hypothetical protein OGI71_13105 [Sphingobacterium sp. ML3W]
MEKQQKRKSYVVPSVTTTIVELEQGIAAGSASVNPGDSSNPSSPKTEDWFDNGSQNSDFDI